MSATTLANITFRYFLIISNKSRKTGNPKTYRISNFIPQVRQKKTDKQIVENFISYNL